MASAHARRRTLIRMLLMLQQHRAATAPARGKAALTEPLLPLQRGLPVRQLASLARVRMPLHQWPPPNGLRHVAQLVQLCLRPQFLPLRCPHSHRWLGLCQLPKAAKRVRSARRAQLCQRPSAAPAPQRLRPHSRRSQCRVGMVRPLSHRSPCQACRPWHRQPPKAALLPQAVPLLQPLPLRHPSLLRHTSVWQQLRQKQQSVRLRPTRFQFQRQQRRKPWLPQRKTTMHLCSHDLL